MTDEELIRLARGRREGPHVEFERSPSNRRDIRHTVCAFANDLANSGRPGVLFVGLEDDGSCAGLVVDDCLLRDLSQIRDEGSILPRPSIEIRRLAVDGCEVAVLVVHPSAVPPVRYDGRVWVRVGSTNRQATPEEESRLAERRRAGDLPFDLRPVPDVGTDDLDLERFRREYLPAAIAPDILEANRRSTERQLEALRFSTRGQPNYAAVLIFGRDPLRWVPGAWVQFLRIEGADLGDPVKDDKRLDGTLPDVARGLDEIFRAHIAHAVQIDAASRETRVPDYPLAALQQLARNALIHRDWEVSRAPVTIHWFEDRIEIANPGGLYGQVTPENFGTATDYRNPQLAEAMRVLGFVQRFGYGIPLARRELERNGNPPPEFRLDEPTRFHVTVRKRR
jgi:ATP-dependent DNA helicase RecG